MKDIHLFSGRLGNEMFRHAYLYSQVREGMIPDVYVQDPKYFSKYSEEIKSLFGEGISIIPYVSIHIRRGDYVNNPFYVDLTNTDYYKKAIDMFTGKKFLVFSDDHEFVTEFCRKNGNDFIKTKCDSPVEEMNMMASCEHNIIANSSFSWWAAYLNKNPNKKVVAPSIKNWYADCIERTVCPSGWVRI